MWTKTFPIYLIRASYLHRKLVKRWWNDIDNKKHVLCPEDELHCLVCVSGLFLLFLSAAVSVQLHRYEPAVSLSLTQTRLPKHLNHTDAFFFACWPQIAHKLPSHYCDLFPKSAAWLSVWIHSVHFCSLWTSIFKDFLSITMNIQSAFFSC